MQVKITYLKTGHVEIRENVCEISFANQKLGILGRNPIHFSFFSPSDPVKIEIFDSKEILPTAPGYENTTVAALAEISDSEKELTCHICGGPSH